MEIRTKKIALALVGGSLSAPSKMPCHGYSLPNTVCGVGSKLKVVVGSVCSDCYSGKGNYMFSNVQQALHSRMESLIADPKHWAKAMVYLIAGMEYFRWHDSGDLLGEWHLELIVKIARALPETKFWLPTKEKALVLRYFKNRSVPKNLTIRLSAPMIGMVIDSPMPRKIQTSSVIHKKQTPLKMHGVICSAPKNGGNCGDCRACWNKSISNISYIKH